MAAVETSPGAASATGDVAIRLVGVSKAYPGVQALSDIDFDLQVGEVHSLVGENGAGKSTLLKILTGAHPPTEGHVEVFGDRVEFNGPRDAQQLGIAAVYQELTVIPALTAAANVFLGQTRSRLGFLSEGAMRARFESLCAEFGVAIAPNALAGDLSVADQQVLEIMRALEAAARIVVLDEPTATLAPHEREALYSIIRRLSERGVAMIYISHDLDEVLRLSDRVTVLRDGQRVDGRPASEWTKTGLVRAMLGRTAAMHVPKTRERRTEALRAAEVNVPGFLEDVELTVAAGEIVGIAGLVGSGRSELLRAFAGLDPASSGSIWIDGRERRWPRSPRQALRVGVALAPEDRKTQGLIQQLSVADNINLPALSAGAHLGFLRRGKVLGSAGARADRVALSRVVLERRVGTLSGGNQQKALVARWIERGVRVLLVDEPTRGIDVGAKVEVFTLLDALAANGLGVVMVSSELEEVIDHSDRVVALARGRVVAEFDASNLEVQDVLGALFDVEEM
ncbi:MAG TPA: sugar ABC transporter ATP-binding protein [Gaiellaceae bacterium]